ncbi:hypothetical protein PAHAL_6G207200 [Panicum hallii]|uniref:Uncharacterized protein n=1 Tax=Panicum hallii TaxID=206008 RepID=A0A2T8IH03_9POAL|nr:hypothetical protein PAHAL_6G207200 [Panicum hallii]
MACRLPIPLDAGSSLPRNLHARHLRCLMHKQLDELLRAPVCRPRRGRGRGAGFAGRGPRSPSSSFASPTRAASSDSSSLATRRGPPVMPGTCTAPECILVESLRHCESHEWTARVRLQPDGLPQEVPDVVTSYYPCHVWMNYACRDAGPSSAEHAFTMASPRCAISPSPSSEYSSTKSATPLYIATPAELPDFLRGTIAACPGAPPFYMTPWFPGRPTAAAAANARPGLSCRIIKTEHVSAEMSAGGEACRQPPSGEGRPERGGDEA